MLAPTTLEFFRALPVGVRILVGMNWALMAIAAAMILVLFVRPHLRLRERRVSVIRAHPLTLWLFLLCSLNMLLFVISGAMCGRYQFPVGTYREAAGDLFRFLLCVAFLPLTRRRFRLAPDGLDATTSFGRKRFVRWDDVASLHFSVLFGFVLTLVDGRRLYLPGALYGLASFSEEAAARLTAERMTARAKARVSLDRARLS